MRSKFARRRPFKTWATNEIKQEIEVSLPLKGVPPDINSCFSSHDIGDAICAQIRIHFNRASAKDFELDEMRDETEKNIAVLIGCFELTCVAKWPFYLQLRLARIIQALAAASIGVRDPILEPKNPLPGKSAPGVERWRMYCVLAVQAKRRLDSSNAKDAKRSFLKDLERLIELDSVSGKWEVLFPVRGRSKVSDGVERRCQLLDDWSKPRTIDRLSKLVLHEYEILSENFSTCLSESCREAYQAILSFAALQAKSLLEARG